MSKFAATIGYIRRLVPSHVPDSVANRGFSAVQREILLQFVLNLMLIAMIAGLPTTFPMFGKVEWMTPLAFYYSVAAALVMLTLARAMNYFLRAGVLITLFYLAGIMLLTAQGLSGAGIAILLFSLVLTGLLFELIPGMVIFTIAALGFAMIGRSILSGGIPLASQSLSAPAIPGIIFIVLGLLAILAAQVNHHGAVRALKTQQNLTDHAQAERAGLEKQLQQHTTETRRRLSQFEVASQIARDISAETSLEPLLQNAVNAIRDRFGFYHAGIFLNDETNEYAVLRAATGEAGRQMLERRHRLKIGETGIVGYVASQGAPRIAEDVGADSVHFKNPLLPATRSEMALPLISAGRAIGALDVQSTNENAFLQEDVRILQIVADQLAVAVVNARLVEQLQANLKELEADQRKATRQVWQSHLRNARRKFAYRYHAARLDIEAPETPQALKAVESGQAVIEAVERHTAGQEKTFTTLALPIKIRNEVVGVVDIEFESANVSPDLVHLIESTVNRLAVSLENARLLEEIRYRAERERLVSEITSKVRASAEVDSILRITAQELGQSLGVSEVMVQLRAASPTTEP